MPRRPSAIDIMPGEQTFLVGDNSGDVYQLPLFAKEEELSRSIEITDETKIQKYTPAASDETVHSKANLRALQQQLQRAEKRDIKSTKDSPSFYHTFLFGHTSMLTDLLVTQHTTPDNIVRNYILIADRDEQIRVSRGPPQSYAIEGYCLGHDALVSQICLLNPKFPHLLVSGGAEPNIRFWDWTRQECILRYSMRNLVQHYLSNPPLDPPDDFNMIVSKIWSVPQPEDGVSLI
jgi:tRNA (guanine-N(7)-)-methyltransferase subunit TRM82